MHAVAQLVEAMSFKLEGRGFDSRRFFFNFSLTQSFRPHYGPGVDSASERNKYRATQKKGILKNPTKIEEIQQKNFIDRN
jgi:hypothetical protein